MTVSPAPVLESDFTAALRKARGWRTLVFILLLLMLLAQLVLFLLVRFDVLELERSAQQSPQVTATTDEPEAQLAAATTPPPTTADEPTLEQEGEGVVDEAGDQIEAAGEAVQSGVTVSEDSTTGDILYTLLYASLFLGLVLGILLPLILLLAELVMLNGRMVGISRMTSAFFLSLVLLLFLIPWQAVLNDPNIYGPFRVPGVLYTYTDLQRNADSFGDGAWYQFRGWFRFVAYPIIAIVLLIMIQARSGGAIKEALGEDLVEDETYNEPEPTA